MTHPPRGPAKTTKEIAPGTTLYTTASHGGYYLSPERVAEMPKPFREFVPFGGEQAGPARWFEEDCHWRVVVLSFPQFFPEKAHAAALAMLKVYRPEVYEQFVADAAG